MEACIVIGRSFGPYTILAKLGAGGMGEVYRALSGLTRELLREHILEYMKQLLVELDDDVAARLELVAPSRSRRRSEFIRTAIRRALWELEEQATAAAYRRHPDAAGEAYLDGRAWEPRATRTARKRR